MHKTDLELHTFDFEINYNKFVNYSFIDALYKIQEAMASNEINSLPTITSHLTGEIINDYIFKIVALNSNVPDEYLNLLDLFELLPYLHRFKSIYCDNYLAYKN